MFSWLPWWAQIILGLVLFCLGVTYLLMPFAVFGLKPRLEEVELQLGEIRAELRVIGMRLAGEPEGRVSVPNEDASVRRVPQPAEPRHNPALMRGTDAARTDSFLASEDARLGRSAADQGGYEDAPAPDTLERTMRPTHFEPPVRDVKRAPPTPPPVQTPDYEDEIRPAATRWTSGSAGHGDAGGERRSEPVFRDTPRAPSWRGDVWDAPGERARDTGARDSGAREGSGREMPWRRREELSPRDTGYEPRHEGEPQQRRPRSEPTLRWPPRP